MSDNLPASLPEISAEIAVIEREMPTPAYRRDEGKQERYRALVTARDEQTANLPVDAEGDDDIFAIPAGVDMAQARAVGDILLNTPESERRSLFDSFGALPDGVRFLMAAELVDRRMAIPVPVCAEAVAQFVTEPEGKILAPEWGADIARKMGVARVRIDRLMLEMLRYEGGEAMVERTFAWLLNLAPPCAAAVYRKLAG